MTRIGFDQEDFDKKMQFALEGMAFDLQESLKTKLTKDHGKDTGALQSSIIGSVKDNEVVVTMNSYGEYVEFGTPPHPVNPEFLKGWARRKLGDENLAYAIAAGIKKRGTRPFPFIRNTYNQDVPQIIRENLKRAFRQ